MKEGTDAEGGSLRVMRDAMDAVTRYASRGCAGMACDRVRSAWMGNQLGIIGRAAAAAPVDIREALPDIPWGRLAALADGERGVDSMTADEMQRFVEHVLPEVRRALPPWR